MTGALPLAISVLVGTISIAVVLTSLIDAYKDVQAVEIMGLGNGRKDVAKGHLRSQFFRLATVIVLLIIGALASVGADIHGPAPLPLLIARWLFLFTHVIVAVDSWMSKHERRSLYDRLKGD